MTRIIYYNGVYAPYDHADIHAMERGFLFADGIYEVCQIHHGQIVDLTGHLDRLARSLREISLAPPMNQRALICVMREVIRQNRVHNGLVYVQITRGSAPRDFIFPDPQTTRPGLMIYAQKIDPRLQAAKARHGLKVRSMADIRWRRPDIKSIGLLPQALARQTAREQGCQEAWLLDEQGFVTEGAASNAWIVDHQDRLITRPLDGRILAGITRQTLLKLAARMEITVEQRPFTIAEARSAAEAFITAATNVVMPVCQIDDQPVADGTPGKLSQQVRQKFYDAAELVPVRA